MSAKWAMGTGKPSGDESQNLIYHENKSSSLTGDEYAKALRAGASHSYQFVHQSVVRRITPLEAERLMGFPDGFTDVPHNGKPMSDGPRYRMIGNSMAVNCMDWIGRRIDMFESISKGEGNGC